MTERLERRKHPRVERKFIIRFRLKDSPTQKWNISTIKNISEGGCFFYCNAFYKVGEFLDVAVDDPVFEDTMHFVGQVERCESTGMAIGFREMSKEDKRELVETIFFLLKRQQ